LEEKEMHLVKKVSKELGLTYKELGEKIGYTESNLRKAVSDNRTTLQLKKAIELYMKNLKLEQERERNRKMEQMVKDFISHLFKDDSEKLNFFIDKK
jgi:predicted transcriptional regulator